MPTMNEPPSPQDRTRDFTEDWTRAAIGLLVVGLVFLVGELGLKGQQFASGLFDADTVDFLADQAIAGDRSVYANLGCGVQGPQNIAAVRNRITVKLKEQGVGGAEMAARIANFNAQAAAARVAAVREGNVQDIGPVVLPCGL